MGREEGPDRGGGVERVAHRVVARLGDRSRPLVLAVVDRVELDGRSRGALRPRDVRHLAVAIARSSSSEQASARRHVGESVGNRRGSVAAFEPEHLVLEAVDVDHRERASAGRQSGNHAATGPMAASRSASAHPARYVMTPPFEMPVTKTRDASIGIPARDVVEERAEEVDVASCPPSSQRRPIACGYATTKLFAIGERIPVVPTLDLGAGRARAVQHDHERHRAPGALGTCSRSARR